MPKKESVPTSYEESQPKPEETQVATKAKAKKRRRKTHVDNNPSQNIEIEMGLDGGYNDKKNPFQHPSNILSPSSNNNQSMQPFS